MTRFLTATPSDEIPYAFLCDRNWLIGAIIGAVFYGVHACLYGTCVFFLLQHARKKMTHVLLGIVTALFITGTVGFVTNNQLTVLGFVDNRLFPGGPVYGWIGHVGYEGPWEFAQNASYYAAEALSEGLLLWRTWTVWEHNYYICTLPCALYLVVLGLGIPSIYPMNWDIWRPLIEAWLASAVCLNILMSVLIAVKLLLHARKVRQAMPTRRGVSYLGVAAIIIESSALYGACNVCYVTVFAMPEQPVISTLVWQILAQVVCISPELVILRIALGRAWTRNGPSNAVTTAPTTIRFGHFPRTREKTEDLQPMSFAHSGHSRSTNTTHMSHHSDVVPSATESTFGTEQV